MSVGNGHRAVGAVAVAGAWPVVLVRYRPGVVGETARVVHVVPVPLGAQMDVAGVAFCGALLRLELVETVRPNQGMPCSWCVLSQASARAPASSSQAVAVVYQA
jgi:hypothetical protein